MRKRGVLKGWLCKIIIFYLKIFFPNFVLKFYNPKRSIQDIVSRKNTSDLIMKSIKIIAFFFGAHLSVVAVKRKKKTEKKQSCRPPSLNRLRNIGSVGLPGTQDLFTPNVGKSLVGHREHNTKET